MRNNHYSYRKFLIRISPEHESTESRLVRKDWRSRITGYGYTIRATDELPVFMRGKLMTRSDELPSPLAAQEDAETRIDEFWSAMTENYEI